MSQYTSVCTSALVFLSEDQAVTSTLIIATETGNEHRAVLQLLRNYLVDFEEFGRVAFEMQPFATAGGTQSREVALLNEHQATLLITYMRNSDIVRAFKKRLVKAFYEFARNQRSAIPQSFADALQLAADQQRLIEQQNEQLEAHRPAIAFHEQVTHDSETLLDFAQAFSLLKRKTGQTFTNRTFLDFLRRHGIACQPNIYANIGRDRFKPRKDYINTWFVSELTAVRGVEWMMRPYAISEIVRLIDKERTGTAMVSGYLVAGGAA